jgi:hypothetical protein
VRILASTNVPFRPTTMQIPNLAVIETKRITVYPKHQIQPKTCSAWVKKLPTALRSEYSYVQNNVKSLLKIRTKYIVIIKVLISLIFKQLNFSPQAIKYR